MKLLHDDIFINIRVSTQLAQNKNSYFVFSTESRPLLTLNSDGQGYLEGNALKRLGDHKYHSAY